MHLKGVYIVNRRCSCLLLLLYGPLVKPVYDTAITLYSVYQAQYHVQCV